MDWFIQSRKYLTLQLLGAVQGLQRVFALAWIDLHPGCILRLL
jgi:hypothetical protein